MAHRGMVNSLVIIPLTMYPIPCSEFYPCTVRWENPGLFGNAPSVGAPPRYWLKRFKRSHSPASFTVQNDIIYVNGRSKSKLFYKRNFESTALMHIHVFLETRNMPNYL